VEGFRVNGNRTLSYPGTEHNVVSFVRKVKVVGGSNRSAYLKWGNREPGIIFQIEIARGTTKKETGAKWRKKPQASLLFLW